MATLLGTPYERGKSDVIVSRKVDAPIEEGLFVADAGEGKVAVNGETPLGIMGQNEIVGCSVVVAGLKVYVQADAGCQPTLGGQVHVTAEGKVSHEGGTAINATFAEGAVKENGVTDNTATKATNRRCVAINMVGGC